jgi:D-tyrosyl-tRNA(Tyr) deacylase
MRAVVQRVARARVTVEGVEVGSIGSGLAVLLGVGGGDGREDAEAMADKLVGLRIFRDDRDRMNLAVGDAGGEMLVVSQFTLLGDVRRGRRPSFAAAAPPVEAEALIGTVVARIEEAGIRCATGSFGAMMEVELVNSGPVTLVVDVAGGRVV